MFSESTLEEIRARINIVELVGEFVPLKKSGQGFTGLCPFHKEKTPSFHVHPHKQIFHCFGCHKGGNLFSFYMAIEGLNFPDCVQRLAKRAGVTIEESKGPRRETFKKEAPRNGRLLEAHEWAAKYFQYLLFEVPEYHFAMEYLKSRGLTEKTIRKFRLGVSPKGWNTLLTLMERRKFTFDELVEAGLVIAREGSPNQGYDRFRQRLMFPITDPEGAVIGFGARLLTEEENQPKYINSPESPLFSKRRVFYGLHENQRGIRLRGEALIVEGYMDVIGLYESGIDSAIATMGTALTEEHCFQLKNLTRKVVTVFDPDAAGLEAWHRSVHIFINAGIFAKDLSLPAGKDPDEFALEEGAEKFHQLCERAPIQLTKLLKEIAERGPLGEEQSGKILADLAPIIIASRRLPVPQRATLWDNISLVLNQPLTALKEIATGAPSTGRSAVTIGVSETKHGTGAPAKGPETRPLNPIDLEFFQASLRWPAEFLKCPQDTWAGGLKESKLQDWLEKLSMAPTIPQFEAILGELLQSETDSRLLAVGSAGLFPAMPSGDEAGKDEGPAAYLAIFERIKRRKRELEIRRLSTQVKLTQRLGNDEEQMRLLERLKQLRAT